MNAAERELDEVDGRSRERLEHDSGTEEHERWCNAREQPNRVE